MTSEQFVAVLSAIAAVLAALAAVLQQLSSMRRALDGALTQLLAAREAAALKEGELLGRDYTAPPNPPLTP